MQQSKFKVTRVEGRLFSALIIETEVNNQDTITHGFNIVEEVIKEYSIPRENIEYMFLTKQKGKENVRIIKIEYCKLNKNKLNNMPKKDAIKAVLKEYGYSDENINSIKYENYTGLNDNNKVWVVKLHNPDLKGKMIDRVTSYRLGAPISKDLKKVLGFCAIIEFI